METTKTTMREILIERIQRRRTRKWCIIAGGIAIFTIIRVYLVKDIINVEIYFPLFIMIFGAVAALIVWGVTMHNPSQREILEDARKMEGELLKQKEIVGKKIKELRKKHGTEFYKSDPEYFNFLCEKIQEKKEKQKDAKKTIKKLNRFLRKQ